MNVGIDEVGRGPWAGPLVFGSVVLGSVHIDGLTDSKKLSKKRRESLDAMIRQSALAIGLGWVSAAELDEIGMSAALRLACRRSLEEISIPYTGIILDGTINFLDGTGKGPYVTTMKQADLLVPSVSAASIVAKVARDAYMSELDTKYPGYGFGSHAGYGTAAHKQAIELLGVTPEHRMSFAPLSRYTAVPQSPIPSPPSKSAGALGEDSAASYLAAQGYTIIERNWRTKACEIDIVAEKHNVVYFVEVKYRSKASQGGGLAAITPAKLRHMERAAKIWLHRYGNRDARLSAIEVTGSGYRVTQFLEQV